MNYVLLKCGKNDYMIVNENEWKEFNKRKDGIPKKDRKDRSYKIADRVFLLKETKKIKNIFSGSYVDMYKLMPEIVKNLQMRYYYILKILREENGILFFILLRILLIVISSQTNMIFILKH